MRRVVAPIAVVAVLAAAQAGAATKTQLASIVVPGSQLGSAAAGLQVELVSGETSNARAADESFDPTDTAASIGKAGRISGYRLYYGDPGFEALRRGAGLIDLGTSLDFFKSARQVRAYETKLIRDLNAVRGQNFQGVVVERVSTFPVRGLGAAAIGVRVVQRIGTKRVYNTYVDFQLGRLLGEAAIRRADAKSADTEAVAVAKRLSDRAVKYVRGTLKAVPVALPRPLGSSRPGKGAPDLKSMVLRPKDIRQPSVVVAEGYAPDDNAIASYFRQFRFDPQTGLLLLRSSATLERTRREAAGRMLVLRSTFTGPEAAETLAGYVTPLVQAPKLVGVRRGLGVGEESFAVGVSFTTQSQRVQVVLVQVRRDRVIGTLIAIGIPKAKGLANARIAGYAKALDGAIKGTLSNKPRLAA
jgi:hypothetical protein